MNKKYFYLLTSSYNRFTERGIAGGAEKMNARGPYVSNDDENDYRVGAEILFSCDLNYGMAHLLL